MLTRSFFPFLAIMNCASAAVLVVDPSAPEGRAHATIQAAVDAAQPGDIVKIRGGVYYEHVHVTKGGVEGKPLVIEAAGNELVLINAGRKLEARWEPAPGRPGVFVSEAPKTWDAETSALWEMPSRLRLAQTQAPEQTALRLGSWCYDGGKIYLRGTGLRPPAEAEYWIESKDQAALTVEASHVHLRNLQVALGRHGILFGKKSSHLKVEGCRAFCNSWAGIHVSGDDHRIVRNETFQNNTYGIQLRYGVNRVQVRGNLCLFNGPNNGASTPGTSVPTDLGIYSQGDFNLVEGNIVEGLHEDVYRNKTGHGIRPTNILRNNVIKGNQTPGPYGVYNNTLLVRGLGMRAGMYRNGGPASVMRTWELVDPSGAQRALNLIYPLEQKDDPRFADPAYRDYRLQSDSPYHGRGAFPGREPVYYVDPEKGADTNSGLSEREAFATTGAALQNLCAGATLYLLPGTYAEPLTVQNGGISPEEPLRIRALGRREGVRFTAPLRVAEGNFVEIEGLEFTAPLELENASQVTVKHCVFQGEGAGIRAKAAPFLTVDHCTFAENAVAVQLLASPDARVAQNLFRDCTLAFDLDAAGVFADFNAYSRFAAKRENKTWKALADWSGETGVDVNSSEGTFTLSPEFRLPAGDSLAGAAVDFGPLGARVEEAAATLEVKNLQLAGASPKGGTLLWDSPGKATFAEITLKTVSGETVASWEPSFLMQIMASSFDMNFFHSAFHSSQRHASLPELKPDTAYEATVVARDLEGNRSQPARITFRTPAKYAAPAKYYISPEGSDAAEGSAQAPWRSFAHATAKLSPGDELIMLPGHYRETLRPRVGGTKERPVVIRAGKPGEAVMDFSGGQPVGVEILNVDNVTVGGLLFKSGAFRSSECFIIDHAKGITIRDCEVTYPEVSSFEKLKLGYSGLVAHDAPDLRVENNLFLCCVHGAAVSNAPGAVIRGNTFIGEGNYGVVIIPGTADEAYTVEENLYYRAVMGYKTGPCLWVFDPMPQLVSDRNLYFIPEKHKGTIGKLPQTDRLVPLDAWKKESGLDANSVQAEPAFANPEAGDFSLRPSSPGATLARDGGPVGFRKGASPKEADGR
jgi:hypothetical protein